MFSLGNKKKYFSISHVPRFYLELWKFMHGRLNISSVGIFSKIIKFSLSYIFISFLFHQYYKTVFDSTPDRVKLV